MAVRRHLFLSGTHPLLLRLFFVSSCMIVFINGRSSAVAASPPNIVAFNYLSIQGANSTSGYNTVLCGAPPHPQPNSFAQTYCFDTPLLSRKHLASSPIGRVQGTFVFVTSSGPQILFVSESFTINTTTYKGTFTGVGLETIGQVSSKPITGGTGDFARVNGVATTTPLNTGNDSSDNFYAWFKYKFTF
ncbi:hypothetical protein KP509_20G085500 [Ceratopteris richardii]|uniref:Dirigent protein n=1 Tax=Ceratopteris richardii TaxID=49495 RepID=A0A8T2SJ54_CERRI|nr:hypothetical protein KP509_20G085500 [Ceratopteris richardii]